MCDRGFVCDQDSACDQDAVWYGRVLCGQGVTLLLCVVTGQRPGCRAGGVGMIDELGYWSSRVSRRQLELHEAVTGVATGMFWGFGRH